MADDLFSDWDQAVTPSSGDLFSDWDRPEKDAPVHWAGRPTTMAAINSAAEKNGVSPQAIMELGSFAGRFESNLVQNVPGGQAVIRAGEGLKQVGETIVASLSRAAGREDIAARIHQDRRNREEFLQFIERGGDVDTVLGERGGRVFNSVFQSLGSAGSAGVAVGPLGIYANAIGSTWEDGLDEGQRSGLEGGELLMHAGLKAGLEGTITYLMGAAGKRLGFESLEESFSPAARAAAAKQIPSSLISRIAKETGGMTAEGLEEMLIEAGQQVNDVATGLRSSVDLTEIIESGAAGIGGRGVVGAVKSLSKAMEKVQTNLPDVSSGTRAAEVDLERGINPLEVMEYLSKPKEFERQTGRSSTSKQFRDSYRDAIDHYLSEARAAGNAEVMDRYDKDLLALRAEDRARAERVKQSKQRATKAKPAQVAPSVEIPPPRTANERARFSLEDFENRMSSTSARAPVKSDMTPEERAQATVRRTSNVVQPAPTNVNPYTLTPWESETRQQRRIRTLNRDVAQYKQQIKDLRTSFTEKRALREDQLRTAHKLVKENLPSEEHYKYINGIRNAKGPKSVDALLDRVSKAIDTREHRLAVMDLKQAFKKTKNLRKEFADAVQDLRSSYDTSAFRNKDAAVALKKWADENPQAIRTEKDQSLIDRLGKQNVSDMDPEDIRDLSEYVQRLAYESATKDKIIGNQQAAMIRDVGDAIEREAASAPQAAVNADQERDFASYALLEAAERPEATLSRLSPTLTDHIYNKLAIEDQNKYDLATKQITESLAGVLEGVGLSDQKQLTAWRDQKRLLNGVELTRGEAMMIWRWMQDPHAAKSVVESGVSLGEGNRVLPPFTPKMLAELADFVGQRGQHVASFMFSYDNNQLIDSVNATNETLTGRPLTNKRNVVPIVRNEEDFAKFMTQGRAGNYQEALLDSYRSFKHRGEGTGQLAIPKGMDAIDMFMTHADRMNRFASFGVNARNAEMLLNDPSVKNAIQSKNGKDGFEHIVKAVRSHVIGNKPRSANEKKVARFNAATAAGKIALSPSVMLQQTLDPLTAAGWDENGMQDLTAAYSELNARGLQAVEDEMEQVLGPNSGNFWKRYKSGDYVGEHTSGQFKTVGYFRPESLTQKLMTPMTRAEYFAAAMPNYLAAKADARRKFGLPEDDYTTHEDDADWVKSVVTSWDKKMYRGSNSSHGLELSGMLRYAKDNPVAGLLLNFFNTASKVYSLWTMGATRARQGHYKQAGALLGAAMANGAMVTLIQQAMTLSGADEDEPFWKKWAARFSGNLVGLYPGAGELINSSVVEPVARAVMGMESEGFRMDNPVLVYETVGDMLWHGTRAAMEFANVFNESYDIDKASKEFIDASARFLELRGLPAGQVKDLYRRAWREGQFHGLLPENAMETTKKKKD